MLARIGWWPALLAIVAASGVHRALLADHSLWFDEQAAVFFAAQPLRRLWSDWLLRETNPALYYSLLRGWIGVAGDGDRAVRLLSVAASLLGIAALALAARRWYGGRAGLLAALLAALSGWQLLFAEEARAYIFVLVAATVALDAALALTAPTTAARPRWRPLAAYVAATTAAIYLHTTMLLLPVAVLGAVLGADPGRWRRAPAPLVALVLADLAVAAASGWALRAALLQLLHGGGNIEPIGRVGLRDGAAYAIQAVSLGAFPSRLRYAAAALVLLLVARFGWRDRARYTTRVLLLAAVLAFGLLGALGALVPVMVPRTLFWITAPVILVLAGALAERPAPVWWWAAAAALAALLALDAARLGPTLQREDWRTPVARLARRPGALLLVQGEALALLQDAACRRQLARARCPYPVVMVSEPGNRFDSWAAGLYAGPRLAAADLAGAAAGRAVFIYRKPPYHDLVDLLHAQGLGHGVAAGPGAPRLLGPLPAAALR